TTRLSLFSGRESLALEHEKWHGRSQELGLRYRGQRTGRLAQRQFEELEHCGFRDTFSLFEKVHASSGRIELHAHPVPAANLLTGHQVRKRADQFALDGALQMSGAIFQVGSFVQQKVFGRLAQRKKESRSHRAEDALLQQAQLQGEAWG